MYPRKCCHSVYHCATHEYGAIINLCLWSYSLSQSMASDVLLQTKISREEIQWSLHENVYIFELSREFPLSLLIYIIIIMTYNIYINHHSGIHSLQDQSKFLKYLPHSVLRRAVHFDLCLNLYGPDPPLLQRRSRPSWILLHPCLDLFLLQLHHWCSVPRSQKEMRGLED